VISLSFYVRTLRVVVFAVQDEVWQACGSIDEPLGSISFNEANGSDLQDRCAVGERAFQVAAIPAGGAEKNAS
jgi:hypothetical protein